MTASNWGIIDVDWTLDATGNKLKFDRIPDWRRGAVLGKTGNIAPEDYFPEILLTCSQGNFFSFLTPGRQASLTYARVRLYQK